MRKPPVAFLKILFIPLLPSTLTAHPSPSLSLVLCPFSLRPLNTPPVDGSKCPDSTIYVLRRVQGFFSLRRLQKCAGILPRSAALPGCSSSRDVASKASLFAFKHRSTSFFPFVLHLLSLPLHFSPPPAGGRPLPPFGEAGHQVGAAHGGGDCEHEGHEDGLGSSAAGRHQVSERESLLFASERAGD